MSIRWRETLRAALRELRDFGLTALIFGGAQVLLSLPVWAILFRNHPVGLSMALSMIRGLPVSLVTCSASSRDRFMQDPRNRWGRARRYRTAQAPNRLICC